MRFRITIVLMIALGGLIAVSVGLVLFVTASASVKNTLELMRTRAELTISLVERGVADHIAPARQIIDDLRGRMARGELDIDDEARLVDTLSGALAPAPQIGGVVVWRADGVGLLVARRPNGGIATATVSAEERPEFAPFVANFAATGDLQWGKPFNNNGATFVTVAGAVERNGTYAGTVATGVSLIDLSRFVRSLAEEGMTAFVLYGDDRVLAHPAMLDPQYSGQLSAEKPLLSTTEIDDPVLARFRDLPIANLKQDNDFEVREAIDPRVGGGFRDAPGHIVLSRVTTAFGAVPWQIGVVIPVEQVSQQFRRLIGSTAIGLGMLLVSVAAALFLARRIARPIRSVSAAAEKIARLDLDSIAELPRSRIRELDEQARSFNSMVRGLRWFRTYVPHQLVRRLMESSDGISTGVREAELTVMFTDIAGFTPLSENMPPAAVAEMLNRHFEMLIACIEKEGGTVDKFIGDATMAFWGAPEPAPDHAARACRAALAIAGAIEAHHARGEDRDVRVKIALHTGPLIVGNIGAEARMNYTVIGDTVNVCARIESLTGQFAQGRAATILVSGDVVAAAGDAFRFEPVGDHAVKGRARTVEIWRLLGEASNL